VRVVQRRTRTRRALRLPVVHVMTAKAQRDLEAYRRRVRELRAEQVALANGAAGRQETLPIPLGDVVDIRRARAPRAARGPLEGRWVQP
jgi:hypothetical protein